MTNINKTSQKPLTAVVIGAGWAGEGHTKALQYHGVKVVALCARNLERVQKCADRLNVPEASIDWRKSLLKHQPDIVALATPAILRYEPIELATQLGCHILCEKPLASNVIEAKKVRSLVEDAKVKHAFAATHQYDPGVTYIRHLILKERIIGELKEVDIEYTRLVDKTSPNMVKPWNWVSSILYGGGPLNNGLTHKLGMLEKMTGQQVVATVGAARFITKKAPIVSNIYDFRDWCNTEIPMKTAVNLDWRDCDAETEYSAFFKLRTNFDSIFATIRPRANSRWSFYGTKGVLAAHGEYILSDITLNDKSHNKVIEELSIPQPFLDTLPDTGDDTQNKWTALVSNFLADIENRVHKPYLTFHDGLRYQVMIETIRGSVGWTKVSKYD